VCDRIVVLNEWAARIFRANGAPHVKIVINRLGVTHSDLRSKPLPVDRPTDSPITVGFVGRLHEVKGLGVLAEALRQVPREMPLRVHVAGPVDGAHAESVINQFRQATAGDHRVVVSGPIPPDQMGEHLRSLDLLCSPSLWFENGPTIALEAMAVGTPVIGTRLGAFTEIIDDGVNGRLSDPGDAAALAGIISDAATRPRDTIDKWRDALQPQRTMDEIANDYLTLYEQLVAKEVTRQ
jgi:glycosyltransferase involved in cell wall biosynthesis